MDEGVSGGSRRLMGKRGGVRGPPAMQAVEKKFGGCRQAGAGGDDDPERGGERRASDMMQAGRQAGRQAERAHGDVGAKQVRLADFCRWLG
jgi:hypothetical protein